MLERQEEAYRNKGVITSLPVQQNIAAGNTEGGAVLGAGKIAILEAECKESKVQLSDLKHTVFGNVLKVLQCLIWSVECLTMFDYMCCEFDNV